MENFCHLAFMVIGAASQVVLGFTSRFLDGKGWWDSLKGDAKATIWAAATVAVTLASWWIATRLACPDLPTFADVLYLALSYAWGFFFNKAMHDAYKAGLK